MRIACLYIPHFQATVALRRQPHLRGRPAVIADQAPGPPRIVDATPAAAGVVAGMTLTEALSRCPEAIVLEADAPAASSSSCAGPCRASATGWRREKPGTASVGLHGLAALHGGEGALLRALREAIPGDLAPRIGVAAGTFPAWVAAHSAEGGEPVTVPDAAAAFLAPHSVDLLPCSRECRDGLRRFGLPTLGAVAALRPEPLLDRFGHEGRRAWELCRGIDPRPWFPSGSRRRWSSASSCPSPPDVLGSSPPAQIADVISRARTQLARVSPEALRPFIEEGESKETHRGG